MERGAHNEHMKVPYTISEHWSFKVRTVYLVAALQGFSDYLLPDLLNRRCCGFNLGPSTLITRCFFLNNVHKTARVTVYKAVVKTEPFVF